MDETGEAAVAYVAKSPGQPVEQSGKALGQKTEELALPIIGDLPLNRVRVEG